jgi:hypothetical protein
MGRAYLLNSQAGFLEILPEEVVMSEDNGLYIQGIEVTQGIQYYRSDMHLIDPLDQAPDNAARIVAYKAAWVRVYVRSGSHKSISNVTGSLRVERYSPQSFLAKLTPQPPATVHAFPEPESSGPDIPYITPHTFYQWERSNLAATLNFIIPSQFMCGLLRLTAGVSATGGQTHEMVTLVNATLHQQIRFRGIMVGYMGPDPIVAGPTTRNPPTLTDLQITSALTLLMYPVSSTASYESAGTVTATTPLGPNGCDGNLGWEELAKKLKKAVVADGPKPGCIYYGLITHDVPGISQNNLVGGGGCNWGSVAASFAGQPQVDRVMAHEIGHFFHPHAPCGLKIGDSGDPNYPVYEPYDPASIGEYGLNIDGGDVMPPGTYKDIMSYCPPNVWMSLYGHKICTNHPLLNPKSVCDPSFAWKPQLFHDPKIYIPDPTFPFARAQPKPTIFIVGIQDPMGRIIIEDVYRAVTLAQPQGEPTSLVAVLDGQDGQPLVSAPLFSTSGAMYGSSGCGCAGSAGQPPFLVEAMLPDIAPGTALRVLQDGEEIWRRDAPPEPATVSDLSPEIIEHNRLALRWRAESPQDHQLEYWVRWSAGDGEPWNSLGTGITESEAQFGLEGLPPGEVHLQVVAHDGFFSEASEPVTVTVPAQPPIFTILHPQEGGVIPAGDTLHLWVAATNIEPEFEVDDFRWFIDGREVGRGLEVWMVAPDAGEHRCTLRLEGDRKRIQRTVLFKTVVTSEPCRAPWS